MSGKRLVKRVAKVAIMTAGFFLLLTVVRVEATPIRPDVRKLLSEPQQSATQFPPARAGWNGPETPSSPQMVNTTYEQLRPAATVRMVRSSLLAASIPDYRALAAIALVILLLRRIRKTRRQVVASAPRTSATAHTLPLTAHDQESEQIERVA